MDTIRLVEEQKEKGISMAATLQTAIAKVLPLPLFDRAPS